MLVKSMIYDKIKVVNVMKKNKIWILSSLAFVIVIIGFILIITKGERYKDNVVFADEYKQVSKDNPFVYRDAKEIIKILEHGTGVVYFGFPDCPWCQAYVGILNNVAKKEKIEKIYYFDIYEAREKDTKEYKKIVSILKKYLKSDEEGNPRVYVPDVYVVVDGKIINHNNETSVVEEDILPVSYWTDERIKELEKTLTKNFEPLKAKVCTHCN